MSEITIGSTIIGKSGKKLIVDRVEGDTIYSGDLKILLSAVIEVIPPAPKSKTPKLVLGDRARYIGTHPSFKKQYGGVLTIWELGKGSDLDKCACLTPGGKVSTWIEYSALELVEVAQ
jgi:hypothetical protein